MKDVDEYLVGIPSYMIDLLRLVKTKDWLSHNFQTDHPDELYNPANYLYNRELGRSYTAVIDLNILQFLINGYKTERAHENYRIAASFVAFCQFSEIEIDPTYAVYEKVDYNRLNVTQALSDLAVFNAINNAPIENLAAYALGLTPSLDIGEPGVARQEVGESLLKYRRLKEWDSIYLLTLAIVQIHTAGDIPHQKKLVTFIEWMLLRFRLSLPAIAFAVRLFGRDPVRGLMKFKKTTTSEKRRRALSNMTWDLYLINRFFRLWTDQGTLQETLLLSDDHALRVVLRLAIEMQATNSLDPMGRFLNHQVFVEACNLLESEDREGRAYLSAKWGPAYRQRLIEELEGELLS